MSLDQLGDKDLSPASQSRAAADERGRARVDELGQSQSQLEQDMQ